jgi:excinuclease ABC subunit C
MAMPSGGADLEDDTESVSQSLEVKVLEAFIAQHYLSIPVLPVLITSEKINAKVIDAISPCKSGVKVTAVHNPREQRRAWLEMAEKNAAIQLARLLAEEGSQQARTRALVEALDLAPDDIDALRMECFDISHTSGEATQASCVVFQNHKMQNSEYRRYKIEGITRATITQPCVRFCCGAMARWPRPFNRARQYPKLRMPDVVLIDGGKGQVSMAKEVFESWALDLSLIVGVEKGEGRKVGLGRACICRWPRQSLPGQGSAALMLVAQVRDEAHRFAITGMRAAQRAQGTVWGSRHRGDCRHRPQKRAAAAATVWWCQRGRGRQCGMT